MKTKRVRPVLVESKNRTKLLIEDGILTTIIPSHRIQLGDTFQELILISLEDEKIEVGNEYLDDCGLIREAVTSDEDYWKRRPDYKKVIARQSQISPEYISKFIKQYNNGYVKYLEIGMETRTYQPCDNNYEKCGEPFNIEKPKLTNGFVTIVEEKQVLYTKKDMSDAFEAGHNLGRSGYPFEEWLDKNKKK